MPRRPVNHFGNRESFGMSQQKEGELITAVLLYAMRCLVEGDQAALRGMNFGPKEMDALKTLSLADLYRVDSLRAHCLNIHLNRQVFWPMITHLRQQRESEELQQQLIQADAPLEMMHQLFGMCGREYTRWRRLLTLAPAVGRPRLLTHQCADRCHTREFFPMTPLPARLTPPRLCPGQPPPWPCLLTPQPNPGHPGVTPSRQRAQTAPRRGGARLGGRRVASHSAPCASR